MRSSAEEKRQGKLGEPGSNQFRRPFVHTHGLPNALLVQQLRDGGIVDRTEFLPISDRPAWQKFDQQYLADDAVGDDDQGLARVFVNEPMPHRQQAGAKIVE